LAGIATLALVVGGAMTALAPAVNAGPNLGRSVTPPSGGELVRGSDGSVHALVPSKPIARPVGVSKTAAPATIATTFLARKASIFGARSSDLKATKTVKLGTQGSIVRFAQSLGGIPVLGGELVVSLDRNGALQSITGESAHGSVRADSGSKPSLKTMSRQVSKARGFVTKRTGVKNLNVNRIKEVIVNPQLLGVPKGINANIRATQFLVTGDHGVSYFVFVNKALGVVAGFSNSEEGNNRQICSAGGNVFPDPNDAYCRQGNANVTVTRSEGQGAVSDTDTNNVYNNLGYTQQTYANYTGYDLPPNIGLTDTEAGGSGNVEKVRATVHYCLDFSDCPMVNAFWNDTYSSTGVFLGGQMYYGNGLTQDDITGHEVSHGVTASTSNLFYWFQSGAINESMSDVFGEMIDLVDSNYGSPAEPASDAWKIGEGSAIGVIRSMSDPPSVLQYDNSKGQPDKMTSPDWWDVDDTIDSGGVHLNSGVGNKAAYLMANGATFNGQVVRKLGFAKTFAIYWTAENLLTSGADYKDLFTALQTACSKNIGNKYITADDCAQVKKAVVATEMFKDANAVDNLPVATPYCPTGKTVQASLSQGFDATPAGWTGVTLAKRDYGFDYVNTGADSALVVGGPSQPLTHTAGVKVPPGGMLRIDYAAYGPPGIHGFARYATNPAGPFFTLPSAGAVNPGPWELSPGWSSAKWDLSRIGNAGQTIYLRFATDEAEPAGDFGLFVDNVKVYRCV